MTIRVAERDMSLHRSCTHLVVFTPLPDLVCGRVEQCQRQVVKRKARDDSAHCKGVAARGDCQIRELAAGGLRLARAAAGGLAA